MRSKKCQVCSEGEPNYKCPTCLIIFCSIPCNKTHKQNGCVKTGAQNAQQAEQQAQGRGPRGHSGHNGKRGGKMDVHADEERQLMLSADQLCDLDVHDEVQRKFRDQRVKAIVQRIDGAADRAKALEKEMADPAFLEFCDDILQALAVKPVDDSPLSMEDWFVQHCNSAIS